jgi:hypothetical protein
MNMKEYERVQQLKKQGYTQEEALHVVYEERSLAETVLQQINERKD